LLPKSTAELIGSCKAPNAVPVIAGCNLGEIDGTGVPYLTYPSLIQANINVANFCAAAGHKSFVYLFDRVPPGWRKGGCVAFHRLEPGYVFGDWDDHYGFFSSDAFPLAKASGAKQAAPELDAADRRVSEAMMEMWTAFARHGDPEVNGLARWPQYKSQDDSYLLIVDPPQAKSGYSRLVDTR
jgi:carboxylesterase type B